MTPIERRLVVTGHDAQGRGIVASDTRTGGKPVPGMEGYQIADIWGADQRVTYPDRGERPPYTDFFPGKDGFRFMEVLVPAKSVVEHDTSLHGAAAADMQASMPGLADTMAQGRPGMHRTATVDMIIVIEGACVLTLDTADVVLKAGDTAIQCGTMHAWTNPFDQPCRFMAVLIGANHEAI